MRFATSLLATLLIASSAHAQSVITDKMVATPDAIITDNMVLTPNALITDDAVITPGAIITNNGIITPGASITSGGIVTPGAIINTIGGNRTAPVAVQQPVVAPVAPRVPTVSRQGVSYEHHQNPANITVVSDDMDDDTEVEEATPAVFQPKVAEPCHCKGHGQCKQHSKKKPAAKPKAGVKAKTTQAAPAKATASSPTITAPGVTVSPSGITAPGVTISPSGITAPGVVISQ